MSGAEILAALMFLSVCGALLSGYNAVSYTHLRAHETDS